MCVDDLLYGLNTEERPHSNREVVAKADPVPLTGLEDILVVAVLGLSSEQHRL